MDKLGDASNQQTFDLPSCDREPIHILRRVQSYGALLALSADWVVVHASENIAEFLGQSATDLIGASADAILEEELTHDIRGHLQLLRSKNSVERVFQRKIAGRPHPVDIAVHTSGLT